MSHSTQGHEDLFKKLEDYQVKLKQVSSQIKLAACAGRRNFSTQVESLCASNPDNEEFQKLKTDLVDVIKLTSELVTLSGSKPGTHDSRNASETAHPELSVGQRVEAQSAAAGGNLWYPGVVGAVHSDSTVSVRYIGFGSEERLAQSSVRRLLPHPSAAIEAREVTPGMKVTAKYAGDGQWYAARVDEIISSDPTLAIVEQAEDTAATAAAGNAAQGSSGVGALWRVVRVTYLQYNSAETVPLEYIRHTGGAAGKGTVSEMEGAAAAAAAAAGDTFDIPDHLRLLPTDSEAERKRKRRAVKGLKLKHKTNVMVAAAASRKGSWQDFQGKLGKGKKGGTKRVRGFISSALGLSKSKSIFATCDKPSSVDVEAVSAKKPRLVDA